MSDHQTHLLNYLPLPPLSVEALPTLGIPEWREQLEAQWADALATGTPIRHIVLTRSHAVDAMIRALFDFYQLQNTPLALFATGGYGRGELHPHSDVDMLLLSEQPLDDALSKKVATFIATLWDISIEPAIVVRSVASCREVCQTDISVATSLLEARFLVGNRELVAVPFTILSACWSQADFFHAKMAEAKARYLKNNATEYNLEPDIKHAPGGLRDIHTVGWVGKRYFAVSRLADLVQQGFISQTEYQTLMTAEDFLWRIRHHLHRLTGRNENRLRFDYQRNVATLMGYQAQAGDHANAVVERFMRDYYRFAISNATLSEMITQHYHETLIEPQLPITQQPVHQVINERFKQMGEQLAITHAQVFVQHPSAILELFLLMGQYNIRQIRTATLRALTCAVAHIDDNYRTEPRHQQLFLANLKEQNLLYWRLRLMNRYEVLGRYLPAFGQVVGLMQYDLFHCYTVDTHILMVIRVLHRFTDDKYVDMFPLASEIYQHIENKVVVVLSAIFHDIAKGQGGDHSELGEQMAMDFCLAHGLSQSDAKLVGWLVAQHLLMSITAQKKDISDPAVVADFAEKVGNLTYLNHLYVLTVADMNATNPKIWNSWRATLLRQLYTQTRRMLRADLDAPMNRQAVIERHQRGARALLAQDPTLHQWADEIEQLWAQLGDEYFLREKPDDIVWHSQAIMHHHKSPQADEPLIILREHHELARDAVQVFIYTKNQSNLFASTTAVFDRMNLDVVDARVITATRDFALDSYVLLDRHGTLLNEVERQQTLMQQLKHAFANPQSPPTIDRRLPSALRHFNVPTRVEFEFNPQIQQHRLSLEALDQPALLARVGQVFLVHKIAVHFARITTFGERAEDVFLITDSEDKPLSDEQLGKLKEALVETLNVS